MGMLGSRWPTPDEPPQLAADQPSQRPVPGIPHDDRDARLLARLIYTEGGGEYRTPDAMEGIGWTVRNRIGAPTFSGTLAGVVFLRRAGGNFEYAVNSRRWATSEDPSSMRGPEAAAYDRASEVARGILTGEIPDPTGGAKYFHSNGDVPPRGFFADGIASGKLVPVDHPAPGQIRFYRERPQW